MSSRSRIGVMYDRALPPEGLMEFARTVGPDPLGQFTATIGELR